MSIYEPVDDMCLSLFAQPPPPPQIKRDKDFSGEEIEKKFWGEWKVRYTVSLFFIYIVFKDTISVHFIH